MSFNLDVAIVVVFLLVNLCVGLYSGRGVTSIREYAIGDRNFSTATVTATIVATWIGGGFFAIGVSQTYKDGLFFIIAGMGDIIALLIFAYVFAKHMTNFLGKISVAEVMGDLYGKNIRIISAIASLAISIGAIALQIKVLSSLFNHFLGFSSIYAVLISSVVIIIYSTFGGIKSVTFTDTIQFFTFGSFVPIFALFIWEVLGDHATIISNIQNSSLYDYKELINYNNPKFFPYLLLLLYYTVPYLDPAMFQRTLIAKNTKQIKQSFAIAALMGLFVFSIACGIGVIIYGHNPNLNPNNLVMYIIDNYSYTGLKGIVLVGILAITMSTADSWINISAVLFSHDLCKPLDIKFGISELLLARIFAIFVGFFAVILALKTDNLLELLLFIGNFFSPIVGPILLMATLGFRSTTRVAYIAICCGIGVSLIWRIYFQPSTDIDSVMPGTIANFISLIIAHYLLGEPGGWVKKEQEEINHSVKKK